MFLKIILLTVAIGAVLKILSDRFEKLKRYSWWVGLAGAVATAIVCVVAFWQTEEKPLTKLDFEETSDSQQTEMVCKIDSLSTLIKSMSGQEEPDSTFRALAREQAECLEGIVVTALDKGKVAIGLQKYDEALTLLDLALTAAGENLKQRYEVFFYMGVIRSHQGEYTLALDCYDSCTTYDPTSHASWYNRGYALNELGRHEEAITSFDSALAYKPDKHEAWYNRGWALDRLGRYEEAIASYDSALAYKPDYHKAWNNRGWALDRLGLHDEAIACFDSALAYKPDYYEAWYNRGYALNELGRHEEAITSFDSALAYKPDKHEAWYNRGWALDRLGRHDEAIASFDSALASKPDYHKAWYNRALTLARLNRFEEALSSCDSSLKYDPGDSSTVELRQLIMELMRLMRLMND